MPVLLALEAAARHLNFRRAADELSLTHGAISHQIRNLATQLGVPLFEKRGRNIVITEQGQVVAIGIRQALKLIERTLDDVQQRQERATLVVSVLPSLAAHWLVPRLSGFTAQHPAIDIFLKPSEALADFDRGGIDAAIRYGAGRYPGMRAVKLRNEQVFPVCGPHYNGGMLPRTAREISQAALLRNPKQPWSAWFRAAGHPAFEPTRGPVYQDAGLTIQAAREGHGVALARAMLVREELRLGTLVKLSEVEIDDTYAYWLVWPIASIKAELIDPFLAWLLEEMTDRHH
jgi:LysR family glycine cleavage system transcriptional activator